MRDAVRYRQKKISGKSGDSGDEALMDDASASGLSEKDGHLAFLLPTSVKYPRMTATFGGTKTTTKPHTKVSKDMSPTTANDLSNDSMNASLNDDDAFKMSFEDENSVDNSSVYSYVSSE